MANIARKSEIKPSTSAFPLSTENFTQGSSLVYRHPRNAWSTLSDGLRTPFRDNHVSHGSVNSRDPSDKPCLPSLVRLSEGGGALSPPISYRNTAGNAGRLWSWRYQITCLVFSFVSFSGLVAVAMAFSDQPLSSWPLGNLISINTVVAALTTAMKGALLVPISGTIAQHKWIWFSGLRPGLEKSPRSRQLGDLEAIDEASRGPWGSASWVLRHPWSLSLVSLGAWLTVIAVAFDVFSQQIILIETRRVVENSKGVAQLPWAQEVHPIAAPDWWAAIYDGFLNPVVDDLEGTCPTGNCTWGTVPSVGICGECRNCTDVWLQQNASVSRTCTQVNGSTTSLCNYDGLDVGASLENVPAPGATVDIDEAGEDGSLDVRIPVASVELASDFSYKSKCFPELDPAPWIPLLFEVMQVSFKPTEPESSRYTIGSPNISQCAFYYCMNAFSTDTSLGSQTQTLLQGTSKGQEFDTVNGSFNIYFSDTPGFNMLGENFTVWNWEAYRSYISLGSNFLAFTGSGIGYENPDPTALIWQETNHNRSAWTAKFAKRLSNTIRQQNAVPADQDPYLGIIYSEQVYIRVVWYWIAYPSTVLLAGMLVFGANLLITLRTRTSHWGNGVLVLLLARVDEELQSTVKDRDGHISHEILTDIIGETKVYLQRDMNGWAFRKE